MTEKNRKHCPTDPVQFLGEAFEDGDLAGYTKPGWYFWEETWADCQGPFDSPEEATEACKQYARELDRPPTDGETLIHDKDGEVQSLRARLVNIVDQGNPGIIGELLAKLVEKSNLTEADLHDCGVIDHDETIAPEPTV